MHTAKRIGAAVALATIALAPGAVAAGVMAGSAALEITSATGAPGEVVRVEAVLRTEIALAGTLNRIHFQPQTPIIDCDANAVLELPYEFEPEGCTPGEDCTTVRVLFFDLSIDGLADGATLYTCEVAIAADAAPGEYPLDNADAEASDLDSQLVDIGEIDGSIVVAVATATATASASPSATATAPDPSPPPPTEPSPSVPTATRSPGPPPTPSPDDDEDDACQIDGRGGTGASVHLLALGVLAALRWRHRSAGRPIINVR